jgi:hypothetical protein
LIKSVIEIGRSAGCRRFCHSNQGGEKKSERRIGIARTESGIETEVRTGIGIRVQTVATGLHSGIIEEMVGMPVQEVVVVAVVVARQVTFD